MSDQLWKLTAGEIANLIRSREVSCREVVHAHIERIQEVNAAINAVTVLLAESALAAADDADTREPVGPLHGVPFTVKENIDCLGSATTQGLPSLAKAMPSMDSPVVERMKAAGAVPLARTNLPEMGLRIDTDNPLRGRTYNPWNKSVSVGGSSGGDAAALATGMTPIGLGNDLGGSLRNPSFCCGTTAIKATTGRIPWALSIPPVDQPISYSLMISEGPMARSVADLRLTLEALHGWHPRDPVSVTASLNGPAPARRRAAIVTSIDGQTLPDDFVAAIRRAGEILSAAGWELEEIAPPEVTRVNEIWGRLLCGDITQMMPQIRPMMSEGAALLLDGIIERFGGGDVPSVSIHTERYRLIREWSTFFQQFPVVVGPVWSDVQFPVGADIEPGRCVDLVLGRLKFITPGNLLGIPAIPVPMGQANGLPLAVQIYADRWREDLCLEVAELIEASVGATIPIDPR